jgi:O-antigen/teichoic acid export membrane protein
LGVIQRQGIINTIIIYGGVLLGFYNTLILQPTHLSPDEVGMLRLLVNFSAFLTTFFLLGASATSVKFFPAFKNKEKRHNGFLGLILLIAFAGILAGGLFLFLAKDWLIGKYSDDSPMFAGYYSLIYPLGAIMTISIVLNAYCNSLVKTVIPSFLNDIWLRLLLIVFTLFYSIKLISFDFLVLSIVITYLSQATFLILYILYIDKPSLRIQWSFVEKIGFARIISYSLLMALTALSSLSIKFLDSIMIGAYMPVKFVGIYAIGLFIAQFIETPLYSLERVANTKIAYAFENNDYAQIKEVYYKSVRYLLLLGGFLVVCVITNVHDLLRLLPDDYKSAANVSIIVSIGAMINMATGVNTPIINNSDKYRWSMYFLLLLLVLTVILNLAFIPHCGIIGAAIATAIAGTVFNLCKFFFIRANFNMQPYDAKTIKSLIVILTSLIVGYYCPVPDSPFVAIIIRGISISLIFLLLTVLFKIVPEFHHWIGLKKQSDK